MGKGWGYHEEEWPSGQGDGLGSKASTQLLSVSDLLGDLGQFILSLP